MRKNIVSLACLMAMFGIMCVAVPAQAVPKAPNIPEDLQEGKLLTVHQKQMEKRIRWWKKKILAAQDGQEVVDARNDLLSDYNLYTSKSYQGAFIDYCNKKFIDLLQGKGLDTTDQLDSIKQLNVAIAFSKMKRRNIQPTLDIMVASKDQGIRFLGWQGYRNSMSQILRNKKAIAKYMNSLKNALANEPNPIVLGSVFQAMNVSGDIRKKYRQSTQKALLQAVQACWPARCKQVIAAPSEDMLSAMRSGVTTLSVLGKDMSGDKAASTSALQLIVDLAISSSKAYDKMLAEEASIAKKIDKVSDEKKKELDVRLAKLEDLHKSFNAMLLNCENAINTIANMDHNFFAQAIKADVEVGAAVRTAGLDWLDALQKLGITKPGEKKAAKKTKAATK